jgi:hypothetical protein
MFNLKFSEDTYKKFQKMDEILFSIISDEKDKSTDAMLDHQNIFGDDESTFLAFKYLSMQMLIKDIIEPLHAVIGLYETTQEEVEQMCAEMGKTMQQLLMDMMMSQMAEIIDALSKKVPVDKD